MRIVIVDDEELDYRLLCRNLQRAFEGEELEIYWSASPSDENLSEKIDAADICFIDYRLNNVDGVELIEELSARGVITPLVLLTGDQSRLLDQRAIAAGAADYLHKDRLSTSSIQRLTRHCIARKKQEKRLIDIAYTDQLTKLSNRAAFDQRCNLLLSGKTTDAQPMALLLFDLDGFKDVNDTYGHPYGDAVLQKFAAEMARHFPATDIVARLGGDEFGVLMTLPDPSATPNSLRKWLRSVAKTEHVIEGQRFEIGFSVGAVVFMSGQEGDQLTDILKRADRNLYADKRLRKLLGKEYANFNKLTNLEVHDVVKAMESSVFADGFTLLYQPKVGFRTRQITGLEALIRWDHPDIKLGPSTFIPIAEEYGLISDIGQLVIRRCFAQISDWLKRGIPVPKLAINVSPIQLQDELFSEFVAQTLAEYQIDPQLVEFELTETAFGRGLKRCLAQMQQIADLGCLWAIDDFGIGYSSLSRIHKLPISRLKIDKSFVRQIPTDPAALKISNTIIAMARGLNISVVAEGVENLDQLDGLNLSSGDEVQGTRFFGPLRVEDVEVLLDAAASVQPAITQVPLASAAR